MSQRAVQWFVCTVFSGVLILACAGTRLTQTKVDETRRGKPVSDILVIVIADKKETRESFERKFVDQLKAVGVEAVSSAEAIPMPADLKLEKDAILKVVEEYGNDAVIITHLAGIEKEETFTRTGGSFIGYYGHYGGVYDVVHDPGYYSGYTSVRLETNLYDVKTEKLLWSGQSETKEVKTINKLIDDVLALVIKDLQKNKLLPSKEAS